MKIKFKMPWTSKSPLWYFAGGIVVKNPPLNAGDMALVLGWGTRSPHAMGRLTPHATVTNEPMLQQKVLHVTTKT